MTKSHWGWIGVTVGLLTIGGKVVGVASFAQDIASRVSFLEKNYSAQREDIQYIRNRLDEALDHK